MQCAVERRVGSPPQVRGKRKLFCNAVAGSRITPAGAGKTGANTLGENSVKDHPRRCGENRFSECLFRAHYGSPPQVRGKPSKSISHGLSFGITPAGAGKTHSNGTHGTFSRDHPRRCGENVAPMSSISAAPGSPPQVRGKLRSIPERGAYLGITPAGAGKTLPSCWHSGKV